MGKVRRRGDEGERVRSLAYKANRCRNKSQMRSPLASRNHMFECVLPSPVVSSPGGHVDRGLLIHRQTARRDGNGPTKVTVMRFYLVIQK